MNLTLPNKLVDKTNDIDCATHSRVGRGLGGLLRSGGTYLSETSGFIPEGEYTGEGVSRWETLW